MCISIGFIFWGLIVVATVQTVKISRSTKGSTLSISDICNLDGFRKFETTLSSIVERTHQRNSPFYPVLLFFVRRDFHHQNKVGWMASCRQRAWKAPSRSCNCVQEETRAHVNVQTVRLIGRQCNLRDWEPTAQRQHNQQDDEWTPSAPRGREMLAFAKIELLLTMKTLQRVRLPALVNVLYTGHS